jgi:hypothetical protein
MVIFGISEGFLLISFGMGFFVLFAAKKADKGLMMLGYFVGTLMMLLSILILVNGLVNMPDFFVPSRMMQPMMKMHRCAMMMR